MFDCALFTFWTPHVWFYFVVSRLYIGLYVCLHLFEVTHTARITLFYLIVPRLRLLVVGRCAFIHTRYFAQFTVDYVGRLRVIWTRLVDWF